MSAEKNKALVRRFFEESNKGKAAFMASVDEFYATGVVYHRAIGQETRGLENLKQGVSALFNAFPDRHGTIEDMIAEGDKLVVRWTSTGTHKGEYRGISPTNKKVTGWGISIYRFAGGKIVESWTRADTLGEMQQLGVVPSPEKKK